MQVLFDEAEYAEIQAIARHRRMTVAEWVRQTLRDARREEPQRAAAVKLAAVAHAGAYRFPVCDIDTLLGEIEKGYQAGDT